jgi:hypothetical protein
MAQLPRVSAMEIPAVSTTVGCADGAGAAALLS